MSYFWHSSRSKLAGSPVLLAAVVFMFFAGCMKSGPASQKSGGGNVSGVSEATPGNRAPDNIDPVILMERRFGEAPMLADRVVAGDLPPVSQRLPENPFIVHPVESTGSYGGTIHRALTGDIIQRIGIAKTLSENLMGWERPMPNSIQPHLAESYNFEDDGRIVIFHLRKGLRWSDGQPFTVDDVLFYLVDIKQNPDAVESVVSSDWIVEDKPVEMVKVDDYTLKIISPKPLGTALEKLCRDRVAVPKHIYASLHPKYNPDSTYDEFRRATTEANLIMEPGTPQVSAWVPVEWQRGQRLKYERNPYYWKVDTAGNQLPYADWIEFQVLPEGQLIALKFVNGELDLFGRYTSPDIYPVLKSKEKTGNYVIRLAGPSQSPTFYLNWDAPNPALREAFRSRDVRIALSHAINREEISAVVFHGLLEPGGYTFGPESPFFSRESLKRFSSYKPELSRKLLEEAGYHDTDGDGLRELSDGSRFELTIDVVPTASAGFNGVQVSELVAEYWKDIGIKVNLNVALRDILFARRTNGEYEVHLWSTTWPSHSQYWAYLVPNSPFWHRNAATEGPEWLHEATRLMKETAYTVDPEEVRTKMERIRELHTENVPAISIGPAYRVWGASKRLGNVPEKIVVEDGFRGWSRPVYHEQLYFRSNQD